MKGCTEVGVIDDWYILFMKLGNNIFVVYSKKRENLWAFEWV